MITFFGCAGYTQRICLLKKNIKRKNPEKQTGHDRNIPYLTLSLRKIQSPHACLKAAYDFAPDADVSIQNVL
jgi:hypothetical protein